MKKTLLLFLCFSLLLTSCSFKTTTPAPIEIVQPTKSPSIEIPNIKLIYESDISDEVESFINQKFERKTYTTGLFRIYDPLLDVVCYLWVSTKKEGNTISCMQVSGISLRPQLFYLCKYIGMMKCKNGNIAEFFGIMNISQAIQVNNKNTRGGELWIYPICS